MRKPKYEILNHGVEHCQYFQGCGTYGSNFDHVVTGCGSDAVEAYADAVEQVYQACDDADKLRLPKVPRGYGITQRCKVPADAARQEDCELYVYVSIRWGRLPAAKPRRADDETTHYRSEG